MGFNSAFKGLNRKKTNWIGHILARKCLLIHTIEGKIEERIEVTGKTMVKT